MVLTMLSAIFSSISVGLSEFAVFFLVDSIVKSWLKSVSDQSRYQIWTCEGVVLLLLSIVVIVVHHMPYILLTLTAITFISAHLQYFDVLNRIQLFLYEFYERYNRHVSCDYDDAQLEDSPILLTSSQVHARPTIRRPHQSPSSTDTYISPIHNRIESPANFTPYNIARTSTPRSDQSLSVKSKFKSWVGMNPYVNLPPGLPNRGNNVCFVNSVVQCLAHTPLFVKSLVKEADVVSHVKTTEAIFLKNFADILKKCAILPGSSDRRVVDNVPFCNSVSNLVPHLVSNPRHGPQQQQDAAEVLLWLLNKTNELLIYYRDNHNGPQTRSHRKLLGSPGINKLISKLLGRNEQNEMSKLVAIKKEEDLKLKKYVTMHSLSCIDTVATLSDVSWVTYCRNHATVITELFAGQLAEVRQSSVTNDVSFGTQAFHILPVPLVDPRTMSGLVYLQDCIVAMGSLDELGNDDRNFNPGSVATFNRSTTDMSGDSNSSIVSNCSFTDGQYQTILRFPPNCLILQLNRFCFDQDEKIVRKIRSPVNILEKNLDLSCLAYDKKNVNRRSNPDYLYDLYGVCVHEGCGNTQYGHYLALCHVEDGSWYKFDDEHVTQVNVTHECNSRSIREGAYLLFYKRQADFR